MIFFWLTSCFRYSHQTEMNGNKCNSNKHTPNSNYFHFTSGGFLLLNSYLPLGRTVSALYSDFVVTLVVMFTCLMYFENES